MITNSNAGAAHTFGVDASTPLASPWDGLHNVRYHYNPSGGGFRNAGGRESVATFVNSIAGQNSSFVFEYDLNLSPEVDAATPLDDSVFNTTYRSGKCPFLANAQGGARAIGNPPSSEGSGSGKSGSGKSGSDSVGVWLVGSGTSMDGLVCVDSEGSSKNYPADGSLYDAFAYITVA